MRYGIDMNRPFGYVEGSPPGDVAADAIDQIDHPGFEYLEDSGSQMGSHPAKRQLRTLRPFGER